MEKTLRRRRRFGILAFVTALAALVEGGGSAAAEQWPSFEKGMWRFERTVEDPAHPGAPQTVSHEACTDPSADMRQQNAMLAKAGCVFSAMTREGNRYTFTARCSIKTPAGGTATSQSKTVIVVESEAKYRVEVDGEVDGVANHERLTATRTGDC